MTAPIQQPADLRRGTMRPLTFRLLRRLLLLVCRIVMHLDVRDARNVPETGGCMIVANHLHNLDPVLISIACPRPLHYMAKIEIMTVPILGRILRWSGAFPVNRGKMDRTSIRRAHATVEQGIALGMFPEGTRSRSMKIERVMPGAGLIALKEGVTIVPTAITGTERLPFNGHKRRQRDLPGPDPGHEGVRIVFGEPFLMPSEIDGKRTNAAAATEYMMQRVAALLPESYRGPYSSAQSKVINVGPDTE